MSEPGEVEVEVVGVFEVAVTEGENQPKVPLLILRDAANRELRIPISSCEAFAVHLALARQVVPRPLTHDLAVRVLEKLSTTVGRVVVGKHPLEGPQAAIYLQAPEGEVVIPAQPGDAVALALRAEAPVYATEEALAQWEEGED